jgi:hypothetical protein
MGMHQHTPYSFVYNRSEADTAHSCTSSRAPLRFSSDLL